MTSNYFIDDFLSELNRNPRLAAVLDGPLEGTLVPTDKSGATYFVALAVLVRQDAISKACIAEIAGESVRSILTIPELVDLPVLQIIVSAKCPSSVERVVRILINRESYRDVASFEVIDYRLQVPFRGIKCGWYIPPEAVQALL